MLTAVAVTAEGSGATLRDRAEDTSMRAGDPGRVGLQKAIAMLAHDVGHLERWPVHRLRNFRESFTLSGLETLIVSKGLATAVKCFRERCR